MFAVAAAQVKSVLLCLSILSASQAGPAPRAKKSVFADVKSFVTSAATGGRLLIDSEVLDDESGEWMGSYAADTRGGGFVILMTSRSRPEWTREEFEGEPDSMRRRGYRDVTVPDVKITGLGDDNHFVESSGGEGAELAFIKGVYHVRVFAGSRAVAEGVAWNVVTLIPSE